MGQTKKNRRIHLLNLGFPNVANLSTVVATEGFKISLCHCDKTHSTATLTLESLGVVQEWKC